LGILALLGPQISKGQAQYAPVSLGFNPYVNPLLAGALMATAEVATAVFSMAATAAATMARATTVSTIAALAGEA
jgi:hypothetical protein